MAHVRVPPIPPFSLYGWGISHAREYDTHSGYKFILARATHKGPVMQLHKERYAELSMLKEVGVLLYCLCKNWKHRYLWKYPKAFNA